METVTLSTKEVHRPGLLKALCVGRITTRQAATALRLTMRQVRRLRRRFETGGASALVHLGLVRPSLRKLARRVRETVIHLMTTLYVVFNDRHLTEKLREDHGLTISRESVRRLRRALGHAAVRARR